MILPYLLPAANSASKIDGKSSMPTEFIISCPAIRTLGPSSHRPRQTICSTTISGDLCLASSCNCLKISFDPRAAHDEWTPLRKLVQTKILDNCGCGGFSLLMFKTWAKQWPNSRKSVFSNHSLGNKPAIVAFGVVFVFGVNAA